MATVLVTCVGSGIGQSIIDSLNLKREHRIIGCDGNRNIYAYGYCDDFQYLIDMKSKGYVEQVLKICKDYKVDIVIPGHDQELVLFGSNRKIFENHGIKVIVSEPGIIQISRDKQKWYDFFSPLGCKIVPTYKVKDFRNNPEHSIIPAIIKPSGGSASQGIKIINDLKEISETDDDNIIQPYLLPEETDINYENIRNAVKKGILIQKSEISIQLIFSNDSKYKSIFISKNTLKNGIPVFIDPIDPNEFKYLDEIMKFVPVLEKNGAKGPVNVQGRITSMGILFFEMNMRFTGITGNRALLGFNEVNFTIGDFLGTKDVLLEKYAENKVGVRQVACGTIPRKLENQLKPTMSILGADSRIGQEFIKEKKDQFSKIYTIANKSFRENHNNIFKDPNIIFISIEDPNLDQLLCRTDYLINFVSALAYESEERKYSAIRYIFKLITRIAKAKIRLVINISSQSVYPQNINIKKSENHEVCIESSYAFQKIIMEDFFQSINTVSPVSKVVSLRMPRIIIPYNFEQSGFFGRVIKQYSNGEEISIRSPENNMNIIHITDVIKAIEYIIENYEYADFPYILNVSGENLSLREYCTKIEETIGTDIGKFHYSDDKSTEISSMVNGDIFSELGWQPIKTAKDIIKEIKNHIR